MGASGSIDYTQPSGSNYITSTLLGASNRGTHNVDNGSDFLAQITTTVTQSLTIKYFQRVYDDGTAGYCYYTKTSIDPTPLSGETTPNWSGTISDHSIVKILEIY